MPLCDGLSSYNLEQYALSEVLPAVTYSLKHKQASGNLMVDEQRGDVSLTSKMAITSDLILDAIYNSDFSQIEADAGKVDVNLRSALFFAEKRPFFPEGSETYTFAATGLSEIDPFVTVVHTRTIVNPLVGTKLAGKIGEKHTLALLYAMDEFTPELVPTFGTYAHFPIARYKRTLSRDSYVGGI